MATKKTTLKTPAKKASAKSKGFEPIPILQKWETEIIFDTETSGLLNNASRKASDQPRGVEYALIKQVIRVQEVVDRLEFLANPGFSLSPDVVKIHHITDEMLKDAPPFAAHLSKLQSFVLGTRRIVGQNVWFDLDILMYDLALIGAERKFPWPPEQQCTIDLSYHLKGHRLNLSKLYFELFREEFKDAHRAMADTEACRRCYNELAYNREKE